MDRVPSQNQIPDVVVEAYNCLLQHRIITITEPIREDLAENATGWVFECVAEVPYSDRGNIPCEISLCVLIPGEFPHEPVEIYTVSKEIKGFPHQDAESGKLCLPEEDSAPRDASRLVCYVKWAIEWLEKAVKGMLFKPGDSYELPDFSRELLDPSPLTRLSLIFNEPSNSYEIWKSHIGEFGHVECFWGPELEAVFAARFCDENGLLIRELEFAPDVLKKDVKIEGRWVLIPNICYERHRPPQTYREMEELCSTVSLDFYTLLQKTWSLKNSHKFGILLIGFPIPEKVGSPFTEIHWQPLFFQNLKGFRTQKPNPNLKGPARKPKQIWRRLRENGCFSLDQQLPWGRVENVASERLYARGAHPPKVRSIPIAFFGCGALGSSVVESLARGGVSQLNLFDYDSIKFSNLCRHTLDGSSVGFNKAVALARRLSLANPLSEIKGYPIGVPLNSRSDEAIHQLLEDTDVFIDCTTSETAFDWLNKYAVENGKRLISLFFNLRAELLTICISGDSISCGDIFLDLKGAIQQNRTRIDPEGYFRKPSEEEGIMEGAGCWHPTFPAQNAHIQILAAHAVDIISHSINFKPKSGLAVIVERRAGSTKRCPIGSSC